MNIIVTGGCGFIGSHIVDKLVDNNHDVLVIDNLVTGKLSNLNKKATFIEMDIRDQKISGVFKDFKPEIVYHHAAQIDIQKSIKNPVYDVDVNVAGTTNILQACIDNKVNKIIYSSSAAVYGNPDILPLHEDSEKRPCSIYGVSKYCPEYYIQTFSKLYGLNYTILRYANVYGERQDPKCEGGVISIFIDKFLNSEKVYIFGDGLQTRDFIYVKDVVDANIRVLNDGNNSIYNVSTNVNISINALLDLILKELKHTRSIIEYKPPRDGDIMHSYLDNHKIKIELGWVPKNTIQDGIKQVIKCLLLDK